MFHGSRFHGSRPRPFGPRPANTHVHHHTITPSHPHLTPHAPTHQLTRQHTPAPRPPRLCPPGPAGIAHQVRLVHALANHWDTVLPGRLLHVRYCDLVRDQVCVCVCVCGVAARPAGGGWLRGLLGRERERVWMCGLLGVRERVCGCVFSLEGERERGGRGGGGAETAQPPLRLPRALPSLPATCRPRIRIRPTRLPRRGRRRAPRGACCSTAAYAGSQGCFSSTRRGALWPLPAWRR